MQSAARNTAASLEVAADDSGQGGCRVLPITHDFIATMMGTDRSSVSLAASALQKRGVIEYVRGAVKIVNRRKLEKSACECYDVIRQFEDDLGLR
jgi:CRP-like cAMP-binding protein